MTYLNKKRSGDENIGKLIMFSITIIIAVGLVGLITYFYNSSRENAVAGSVLGSSASTVTELQDVLENVTWSNKCNTISNFDYNAISWIYSFDTSGNATWDCDAVIDDAKLAKVITRESADKAGTIKYKMK